MEVGLLDRWLSDANPWWRNPAWADSDVQLRRAAEAPFTYRPDVLDDLRPGGLYLLRGPRRVGKSTEVKRAIQRLLDAGVPARSVVHVSVEGWHAADLEQLVGHAAAQLEGKPGTCHWFLDEITSVDGPWPAVVKRLRDANLHFAEDTVVLSGSSASRLDDATKALAGRRGRAAHPDRVLLQMPFTQVARSLGLADLPALPPLGPGELDPDTLAERVQVLRPWLAGLVDAWDRYLGIGGYPQAVADHLRFGSVDPSFLETLFDVVHGDALARAGLSPVQTTAGLRSVSRSLCSPLEVAALATEMDVPRAAAKERLEDLRRAFLAFPVHREQGLAPKPRAQAKWYFTDPLLATIAARRGLGSEPDATRMSQQQLGVALLRALERVSPGAALRHDQLLYFRSATRAEIDFVAAAFDGVCVESKFVDRAWGRAFQTVQASPYRYGIVATRSGLRRHEGGWAVPAGLLVYLLGG